MSSCVVVVVVDVGAVNKVVEPCNVVLLDGRWLEDEGGVAAAVKQSRPQEVKGLEPPNQVRRESVRAKENVWTSRGIPAQAMHSTSKRVVER